jgi:hypothetical protein
VFTNDSRLPCAACNAEIPSLGVEFPSEEMELATQDVREMTEKEDDINLDFSKLSKKLQTVRAPSFTLVVVSHGKQGPC